MAHADDLMIDQFPPEGDGSTHLATWYAQGHSDALGDRLLMFDNTSAPSWEILRFRQALARDSRFEAALRMQIERLASFQHPAFPLVRPIAELGHDDGLAVVSTFAPGMRLSDALKKPRSAAFAVRLIRQLVPALAALQDRGVAHGVLNAERIVVAAEGGLIIREHMVGAALGSLELSAASLWFDYGVVVPPTYTTAPTLDGRSDITQLGLVVLSLMVGRRIGPDEYPDKVEELLDGIATRSDRRSRVIFQPLRYWLERALQLDEFMFESARDANDALSELHDEDERADELPRAIGSTSHAGTGSADTIGEATAWPPERRGPRLIAARHGDAAEESTAPALALVSAADAEREPAADLQLSSEALEIQSGAPRPALGLIGWAAVAVAVLAIGEAIFIVRLWRARAATPPSMNAAVVIESPQPGANVLVDDRPAGVTPLQLEVGPRTKSIRVLPSAAAPADHKEADAAAIEQKELTAKVVNKPAAAVLTAPTAPPRTGGFRLSSPIAVHVLDGERVLGSSGDGPIVATAGRHEYDLVNSAIGYRERRVIDVKPGQITSIPVKVPNGIVHINAVPWAAVWIDGNSLGETPLGNLSIAPGEHEIVFRHPQLGERREKIIIRVDAPTRVSANLQRPIETPKR